MVLIGESEVTDLEGGGRGMGGGRGEGGWEWGEIPDHATFREKEHTVGW